MVDFLARKYPRARELGCMSLQLLPAADLPLLVQRFTSLQKLDCDFTHESAGETALSVPRKDVKALRALVQAAPQLRALHLESPEKSKRSFVDESKSTEAGDYKWAQLIKMAEACPHLERLTWRYPSIQIDPDALPPGFTELADLPRRADKLPCGTNYSHACFGAIGPEAAKEAHHERSKLMMRVYALEHDEAYVAAKFAVAHAPP